eukprot:134676_1
MACVSKSRRILSIGYAKNIHLVTLNSNRFFSEYQDYDDVCSSYDAIRRAVAVDKIDNTFELMYSRNYTPVSTRFNIDTISTFGDSYTFEHFKSDLRVLDAGCGTGNYIKVLYDLGIGFIEGIDFSQGMLNKCVEKFESIQTNVLEGQSIRLYPGDLNEPLPYKPQSFDAILLTQVLHHMVNDVDEVDLENIENALQHCYDLLNDKAPLIITTSTPTQLKYGYWFAQFFPRAVTEMCEKHADLEWWYTILTSIGFNEIHSYRIMDFHATSDYLDISGIFDADWRKCDSLFGLVTDFELKNAQREIKQILCDEERTEEFLKECEVSRNNVGHSIALIAFKE